jgi:uncharacterized membrane protein YcaP (DUF421 family)
MDSVVRGAVTYIFVWLVFRIAGKRSLAETTTFDFVLLLIISETTQAALVAKDNSMTNSLLLITTIVGIDIALSLWKQRSEAVEKFFDGVPLIIFQDGSFHSERMTKERIDQEDVLAAARRLRGLKRLDQIEYAVLERDGRITIIPKDSGNREAVT